MEESAHENSYIKIMIAVMIALTVFTLFCVAMARSLAPESDDSLDPILRSALTERIGPVGQVNTSADQISAKPVTAMPDTASMSGEELVAANCAACHQSGVAGAPKTDDESAWAARREAGLDALVASVITGKGAMPPRAGTTLDDDQLRLAVEHLAGFERSDRDGADSESATSEAAAATTTAESGTATMVAAEMTDRIKATADSVCAGCHLAGVAGAPKLGDKEAWAERAEKGLAGMVEVVASGKGAMPARGASDLNNEELATAIEYLMSK